MSTRGGVRGEAQFYSSGVPPLKIDVFNMMPFELASRSILGSILAAQMPPKSRPGGYSETLSNVYQ